MSDFVLELLGTNILLPLHSKSELIGDILICWKLKLLFNMTIPSACFLNRRRLFSYIFSLKYLTVFFVKRILASAKYLKILSRTKCYEIDIANFVKIKSKRKIHIQVLVKFAPNSYFSSGNYFYAETFPSFFGCFYNSKSY